GWPSSLRDKAARGLHLHGKLSSKNETTKQSTPRPLSSESWPEWDPEYYPSTMEADRRAVAERMKPAATIRKEKPRREEADDDDPNVVLPPFPPPMTRNAGDVVKGAETNSARPPAPPAAPESPEASPKSLDSPLKNVGSGNSSHRQTSQPPLRTVSSTPPRKGATPRATPDPIPYIVIVEATPKSVRTRRPECVYQPPGFPALRFDADGRCVVAEKNQGVTPKKEEPEPASDRAESPEVFLPPLPPPLRPPMPCNVVKDAKRTPVHSPPRRCTPQSTNVSPTPSGSKIEESKSTWPRASPSGHTDPPPFPGLEPKSGKVSKASPTIDTNPSGLLERGNVSARPPAPPGAPDSLEAPPKSLESPPKNVGSGNSGQRQTSRPSLRTVSSTPPRKGVTLRATPDPIPYIVIEESTPKSVRTRRHECVYQPPGFPAWRFDADGRRVVAENQGVAPKKEEPKPASDRAESPEIFLPPLPPPLRPPMPCNVVKDAKRTPVHSPPRRRTPQSTNVSPTPSAGKIEESKSTWPRTSPSSRTDPPSLPGLKTKSGKVSKTSPPIDTHPSGLLGCENAFVRSAASDVPSGKHDPNDVDKGAESSRSGDSDRSDETPRAPMAGLPQGLAAAGVQHLSTIEINPGAPLERQNVLVRSVANEVPPGPNDGDSGYESSRSGGSDDTIRASRVGLPGGPGRAAVQQPTPSGHSPVPGIGHNGTPRPRSTSRPYTEYLRPPVATSRRPRKAELAPPHRVPAVSETDREREPTAHSSGSTSRQVGLSAKVIWARQLKYRLDFCATIGDRVKYAAAAQEALKAGYVICPNHVLRRASAIIPIDAALLPIDSALLANSSTSC
ncbi:hypothetical protein FRC00_002555, partial [Tulasnella sp. 408]